MRDSLSINLRKLSYLGSDRNSQPVKASQPVATDTRTALVERTAKAVSLAALWCI